MLRRVGHTVCSNKFKFIIAPLIVAIAISGLIFENLYFFKTLSIENQILFRTLSVILYIICFISFYQSINISNAPPPNLMKPRLKKLLKNNHPFYTEINQCAKQNNRFKPPRTSHCSTCKCVVRMDHHCPYINNCVGFKNFKSFILFTGYGGLFALTFLIFSIKYYFDLKSQKISPLSEGEITIWLFLTFFSFFLALSMCGLAISNIYLAGKNITQLQMLKGNLRLNDKHGTHPNPYDLGFFTNLNTIFSGQKWSFWLPSEIITQNDGTQFYKVPEITYDDIKKLPSHIKQSIKTPVQKSIPQTIQELRQRSKNNYANTIFFFLGKEYRLGSERKEKMQRKQQGFLVERKQQQKQRPLIQQVGFIKTVQQKLQDEQRERQIIDEQLKQIIDENEKVQDEQQQEYKQVIQEIYGQQASITQPSNTAKEQQQQSTMQLVNDQSLLEMLDVTKPQQQQQQH